MKRRLHWWVALLAVFALIAAACGDSDSDDSGSSNDSSGEETTADGDESSGDDMAEDDGDDMAEDDGDDMAEDDGSDDGDVAAVDDAPVPGGTLVIQSTQVPRHLNGAVQSGYATAVPGTQLNASPLLYDEEFNPQPYLAQSWDVSDDGLQITLNLVENAVFHDGEPITSEDVAFSVMTVRDNHPFKTMFAPVESVDTPDDYTAIINLSQPHPAILLAMSPGLLPIIPEHVFNDGQEMATHPRNTEDFVGSGPFRLAEYDPASVIRLEAFDQFFIPERPYLEEIIIEIVPDMATIVLGLENGDTDLAAITGAANILRLQDNDDLVVTSEGHEGLGAINWLEFNLADPVLGVKEVRQAIALAVDRDFIADVLDQGITFPASTGIAPSSPFYSADAEQYATNIDTAKQLLADAGFAEGDIEVSVDYIPPIQVAYAEYVVQALEEIGINAELNVSPDFPTWAGRVAGGEHQMTINQVWNWGDPVIGVHRTYLSSNRVGAIWTNNTGYENADVDALLDQAGQELDPAVRADLYSQFQAIVADEVPIHFLTNAVTWQGYQPRVQNPPLTIWGQMSPMHEVWLAE